jgi:hypothetical protein
MHDTRRNHKLIADYRLQQRLLVCVLLKFLDRVELKLVGNVALGWCVANILVHKPIQSGAETQRERKGDWKTAQ